jgi:gas vesicle protein
VNQLAGEVASLDDGMKKIDDGFRHAAANAKAVIEDARSVTVSFNNQVARSIEATVEAKTDEIRENIGFIQRGLEAKTDEIRENVESFQRGIEEKTDELRGNVEATVGDFIAKVEEVDKKFKNSITAAAENLQKETQSALDLLRHRPGAARQCS